MKCLRLRKKYLLILAAAFIAAGSLFINICYASIVLLLYVIIALLLSLFLIANKVLKKTNWYRNIFVHTRQFVTNAGYRHNHQRNYEIVNIGSNPAVFAFFYEDIKGQNWATGSQGPQMDFEILKYYYSYLKEGGIVLLPIVAFSSCSMYLTHYKPWWRGSVYYARFVKVLENNYQARQCIPSWKKVTGWIKYPLFFTPSAIRYIFMDVKEDTRHLITEQPMQLMELEENAKYYMDSWKREFDIKDLDAPLDEKMEKCHNECARIFADMIDFCKERGLKPYLIFPPVSSVLSGQFSDKTKETYIYSFIRKIQELSEIPFLDYMSDERFASPSLYFDSFFMNLHGRKLFTGQVLRDLGMLKETGK